ncbi:lysoplasmalogenase [Marinilongibacter aquaticus]|uniref:lysoplasmalogenase n=1 Tax=Marinilongibacter aquaticus TaxID=2975157 RepID=UPI0021BD3F48|nr:lysoplasmalogenase [Marinilongibacter aquaticus]UBM58472.1 lysoplasmalogenase [Marinilongibacter aquaticus]
MWGKVQIGYFAVLTTHILCRLAGLDAAAAVSKVLLMPILIFWTYRSIPAKSVKRLLLIALFFAWLGDIFLIFEGQLYFMLGLGGFLLGHACYIALFVPQRGKGYSRLWPVLFFFILFYRVLLMHSIPADLKVPVLVYILVICSMWSFASLRENISKKSFEKVLVGAGLFVLSDSFIAVGKFLDLPTDNLMSLWVMASYGLAQYLIVEGLVAQENDLGKRM